MATKAEVRDRAANDLGLLALGQSLKAQDVSRIEAGYDEVYAQLKKDGLATWASTGEVPGEVPDELVPHVSALIADNCLNAYGVSNDRYKRIKLDYTIALREIKKLTAPNYVSQDNPTDF